MNFDREMKHRIKFRKCKGNCPRKDGKSDRIEFRLKNSGTELNFVSAKRLEELKARNPMWKQHRIKFRKHTNNALSVARKRAEKGKERGKEAWKQNSDHSISMVTLNDEKRRRRRFSQSWRRT